MASLRPVLLYILLAPVACANLEDGTCAGGTAADVDGLCRVRCSASTTCLVGEVCAEGLCRPAPADLFEIRQFDLDRTTVVSGETITMTYVVLGAESVQLIVEESDTNVVVDGDLLRPGGEATYRAGDASGTLVLRAERGRDTLEERRAFTVSSIVDGPRIITFLATPNSGVPGDKVKLEWETDGAQWVTISDGFGTVSDRDDPTGERDYEIAGSTTVVLEAHNDQGGYAKAELTVTTVVDPGGLRINSFDLTSSAIDPGDTVGIVWATQGAARVEVYENGVVVYQSNRGSVVEQGAWIAAPMAPSFYQIKAYDGRGDSELSSTRSVDVSQRAPQPFLTNVEYEPRVLENSGETRVSFTWDVNTPSAVVSLIDIDQNQPVTIQGDSASTSVVGRQTRRFVLSATNESGVADELLTVFAGISESEPNNTVLAGGVRNVSNLAVDGTLEWEANSWDVDYHAVSLQTPGLIRAEVHLPCAGIALELSNSAGITIGTATPNSGDCARIVKTAQPPGTYYLRVTGASPGNPGGSTVVNYTVGVDAIAGAVCGNGQSEPGESCDDGNRAAFDGCSATCEIESAYRYSVMSASTTLPPAGTEVTFSPIGAVGANDDGYVVAPLPFVFPFFGQRHGAIAIHTNGYVSFLPDFIDPASSVTAPAGPSAPNAIIAPFAADLDMRSLQGPPSAVEVSYFSEPSEAVAIRFKNMTFRGPGMGLVDGGVILFETGQFRIFYGSVNGGAMDAFTAGAEDRAGLNTLPVPGCEQGCSAATLLDNRQFIFSRLDDTTGG